MFGSFVNHRGMMGRVATRGLRTLLAALIALLAILAVVSQGLAEIQEPPSFARNVVVFPERDFVVVDGTDFAGDSLKVSVLRNDDQGNPVVVGSATGVADANGFLEVNHPGGVCWGVPPNSPNVTPDILPGDVVQVDVIDPGTGQPTGDGARVTTRNVTAEAAFVNDAGDLEVHGTARLADGSRVPLDELEQRIINPDLVDTAVGRRDMRAVSDAGVELGTISYNGATGNKWTAIYDMSQFTAEEAEEIRNIAVEGQTRIMSWLGIEAAERVGLTIFEVDELGGPGFGGCAAGANFGVTDFGRDAVNAANQEQPLNVTGSSFDASLVEITLTDENGTSVDGDVTQQPDPATGHQTWKATFSNVGSLADGMLTASGTYTIAGEPDPITGDPTTRKIKGAERQILKDVVEPGAPSATPSGAASYPTWQSVKLSRPAGEDRFSKIHYTTNGSAPGLASRVFGEDILVTDDQTIQAKIVDRAGNEGPAAPFAYDIQLAPGTVVDAPPRITPVDAVESTATGVSTPPAFPHEVVIFPERDFVVADGYEPFKKLNFEVVRNGHVVGTASGTTDGLGFLEVNHPGGVCWNGQTPDIMPGDEVFVTDAQGNGDKNSTINVTAEPAQEVGDTIVVHGTAENASGGQIDLSLVEQRIIQPEFREDPGSEIGRRDIRADANGGVVDRPGGRGDLSYDAPGSTDWTAVYTGLNQRERELALEGQTRVLSWLATDDAANRLGITIFEVGESGGPGFGGCPNAATFGATGADRTAINAANQGETLEIYGLSDDASEVAVRLADDQGVPATVDPVAAVITPAPTALHPNAQLWKATFSAAQVDGLAQGDLTASATYKLTGDLPEDPPRDMPVGFEILKDTDAPLAGGLTATPNANAPGASYPIWQAITLEHADDPETEIHFTLNGNDPTPNSRTASSQVVLDARPDAYVLKAIAVDSAGNKSDPRTFDYKIVDGIAPGQPVTPDLTAASDSGASNTDNVTNDATPTFSGIAEARSTVKLFEVTGTGATETLTQVGNATAGDDGSYSVTASTLSDGIHALLVTATDASGNVSAASAALSVTIDTTGPDTSITSGPSGTVNTTSATFDFASSEPQDATFRCRLDTAAFAACTSPRTLTGLAPNRAHTFRVQATDRAGNVEATPAFRTWTIDTVRPTVSTVTPANGARRIAAGTNVTATFSEAVTNVNGTTVRLVRNSTGVRVAATVTYNAGTRRVVLNPNANLVRGATYTATIVGGANGVKDAAGNPLAANRTWSFTIIP